MENLSQRLPGSHNTRLTWVVRFFISVIAIESLGVAPRAGSAAEYPQEPNRIQSRRVRAQDQGAAVEKSQLIGSKLSGRIPRKNSKKQVRTTSRRSVQSRDTATSQSPRLPAAYQRRLASSTETSIGFGWEEGNVVRSSKPTGRGPSADETSFRTARHEVGTRGKSHRRLRRSTSAGVREEYDDSSQIRRLYHADADVTGEYRGPATNRRDETFVDGDPGFYGDSSIYGGPGVYGDSGAYSEGCCGGCSNGECGSCGCGPCATPFGRLCLRAEALAWWTDGFDTPTLVTTGPSNNQVTAGVLGQNGTVVLFGGDDLNGDVRPGGRFAATKWFGSCWALEAEYTYLGQEDETFSASSDGDPVIARPFRNAQNGQEEAGLTAFPGVVQGSLNIVADTDLDIYDIVARRALARNCGRKIDLILGYRYAELDERLSIRDVNQSLVDGTSLDIRDNFDTRNQFHGGEIGFAIETSSCRWSAGLLMKVALGNSESRVTINGATTRTVGAVVAEDVGGFLALPTNIGTFEDEHLTVIPELTFNLSRQLCCGWSATVGYTFFYWSHVARPGDQIDRDLNPSQFPPGQLTGAPLPEFRFTPTDFWAQGLNLGLHCCW